MFDPSIPVPEALQNFFYTHNRLALAFSGGTDSSYLMYAAKACGVALHAYCVKSQFQPAFEHCDAMRLAQSLDVPITVLALDVLQNAQVTANPADRCYHCKQAVFSQILTAAKADGYTALIDGTNASDDAGDRPGMRALAELRVLSPLRLCGVTKAQVRAYSKQAGLFTWNKPAYACLATRIPTDTPIDAEKLAKVERAENVLFGLGFTDFRVRLRGGGAKIQLPLGQFAALCEQRAAVVDALRPDFADILLDLQPRQGE